MKFRGVGTTLLVVFVSACGLYMLIHKVKPDFIKPDNFIEEYIEGIIQDKTGIKIDFTPEEETGGFLQEIDWDKIREMFDREMFDGDDEE